MKLKEIKGENIAVHCKSLTEADLLIEHTESSLNYDEAWFSYGEHICFRAYKGQMIGYADVDYYRKNGYEIIEFSDLVLPELSAEEVLKIRNQLEFEFVREHLGMAYGRSLDEMLRKATVGEVIDMCAQWKADHEKKEPEVETVDICQIIEVMPDGRKCCVHEEDIELDPGVPYGSVRIAVEKILRRFCMEHDGKYIAVHEVVCRVKE